MSVLKLLAVCALVIAVASCGRVGEGGSPPTPTPSQVPLPAHPAAGFDVLITDQDRDVAVHMGQKIELFLRARPGMTSWSGVQVDDSTVLVTIPTGIAGVPGATVVGFLANRAGVANINATATARCAPNQACPAYAMLFQVRITVT